jgi:hypothetical protein
VGIISQLVAYARALLPEDWQGEAGRRFRKTTAVVSQFAADNQVCPRDLVALGRRKLEGLGSREFAAMVKDYAEAENAKIDAELKRRSLECEMRRKEAEAREAEIRVLNAEIELVGRLKEAGAIFRTDEKGNLTVLPAPKDISFAQLENRFLGLEKGRPRTPNESASEG